MNFLEDVVSGRQSDGLHAVLARYGRGSFDGPSAEVAVSRGRIKVAASYLYVPIVGRLASQLASGELSVKGSIIARRELEGELRKAGLSFTVSKRAGVLTYKVSGSFSPQQLSSLYENLSESSILLTARGGGVSLTTSPRVPKPNKMGEPTFTRLQVPASSENLRAVLDAIVPGAGVSSLKQASVSHIIKVDKLVVPEELAGEPASLRRVAAKRRGVLKRTLTVDGRVLEEEFSFFA